MPLSVQWMTVMKKDDIDDAIKKERRRYGANNSFIQAYSDFLFLKTSLVIHLTIMQPEPITSAWRESKPLQ